jgi:biotin carboxylase
MSSPRVVIVEPTSSGCALIGAARRRGLAVTVLSADADERRLPEADRAIIDELLVVETNDEAAVVDAVLGLHGRERLVGILPGFEFYVPVVALLADKLGLPGIPPATAVRVRDKYAMRSALWAGGVRVPAFVAAEELTELMAAGEQVGYPCVVKPVDSAGSVHVSRVDDPAELRAAFLAIEEDETEDMGRATGHRVLVEEYVAGPEYSVEGYVRGGRVHPVAVTEKRLGAAPYFVELGHSVPAPLSPAQVAALHAHADRVCGALGMTLGVFHLELRLTPDGPVPIELGARLPGDHIADLVELTAGVSLADQMLAALTATGGGGTGDPPRVPPRVPVAGIRFLHRPELRRVTAIPDLAPVLAHPAVLGADLYVAPGDAVPPPEDFRCRLGHVLIGADRVETIDAAWSELAPLLEIR